MTTLYIGVDPGRHGGIALLGPRGPKQGLSATVWVHSARVAPLPWSARGLDCGALAHWLAPEGQILGDAKALVEDPCPVVRGGRRQAPRSVETIFCEFGKTLAVLELAGVEITRVSAVTWRKAAGLPRTVGGKTEAERRRNRKALSVARAYALRPDLGMLADGPAEALLLALVAQQRGGRR